MGKSWQYSQENILFADDRLTKIPVAVSIQTARSVYDVHQVNRRPRKRHAVGTQFLAEIFSVSFRFLQMLYKTKGGENGAYKIYYKQQKQRKSVCYVEYS